MKKINLLLIISLLAIFSCSTPSLPPQPPHKPPTQQPTPPILPIPTVPTQPKPIDFFLAYNELFDAELQANFPTDKQQHAFFSKGLFIVGIMTSPHTEKSIQHLDAIIAAYETGFNKELTDKGFTKEIAVEEFDKIRQALTNLNQISKDKNLDTGDLMADLFGIGSGLVVHSDFAVKRTSQTKDFTIE